MTYTDNTVLTWGIWKGTKLANVPANYLLWLYNNNKCDDNLRKYIKENMDGLLKEEQLNSKKRKF